MIHDLESKCVVIPELRDLFLTFAKSHLELIERALEVAENYKEFDSRLRDVALSAGVFSHILGVKVWGPEHTEHIHTQVWSVMRHSLSLLMEPSTKERFGWEQAYIDFQDVIDPPPTKEEREAEIEARRKERFNSMTEEQKWREGKKKLMEVRRYLRELKQGA